MADVIAPVRARRDHARSACVMKGRVASCYFTHHCTKNAVILTYVARPPTHFVHPPIQLLRQMLSPDTAALAAAEHALRELEGMTVDFAVHLLEVRVVIRLDAEMSHTDAS